MLKFQLPKPSGLQLAAAAAVQLYVDNTVFAATNGCVAYGPFKGMSIARKKSWASTRFSPMLLGSYEMELHEEFEWIIRRLNEKVTPKISVIGCAEGYYAVGLKLRCPHATVYAVDSDDKALEVCAENAANNGVELEFRKMPDEFMNVDLIVMDVEGNELAYLNPTQFPCTKRAHIIVELHDFIEYGETKEPVKSSDHLSERYDESHGIRLYVEKGRNPNDWEFLRSYSSDMRYQAVSEDRPCLMGWYVMCPKGEAS